MQDKVLSNLERFKLPIGLSFLGLVLIIGGIVSSNFNKPTPKFPKESIVDEQKSISVDVSGAVLTPGVYKLKIGARIEDSIKEAGGFSENVNSQYVSKHLNMAQILVDGSKVYIPNKGEEGVNAGGSAPLGTVAGVSSKVNINSGSQSEVESLPGIGPVTATKVISGRPYQKIEDLLNKKIVGKAVFEKIKDLVVVY